MRGDDGNGGTEHVGFAGHLKDFIQMGIGNQLRVLRREEAGSPVRSLLQ